MKGAVKYTSRKVLIVLIVALLVVSPMSPIVQISPVHISPIDEASAGDVSDATEVNNTTFGGTGIQVDNNGTYLFVLDPPTTDLARYELTEAYNISTKTNRINKSFGSIDSTSDQSVAVAHDGSKVAWVDSNPDLVRQCDLTTAWDVTTASNCESYDTPEMNGGSHSPVGIKWADNGNKAVIAINAGAGDQLVRVWDLSTPYDVTTESLGSSFDGGAETVHGGDFNSDGTVAYLVYNNVEQYNLTTPYDLSTASLVAEKGSPDGDVDISDNNKYYYELDKGDSQIRQWSGADATALYDISGFVKKSDGTGIEGARVSINASGVADNTTDANGKFQFTDIAEGEDYKLTASASGFINNSATVTNLQADVTNENITLSKSPSSSPTIEDHTQTFELVSNNPVVFPSEGTTLTVLRYVDADGDPVKVGNPEQDPDTVEVVIRKSFNFQNQVNVRLDDGAFYRIVLQGPNGDIWQIDPFLADASGEALWPDPDDDGIVELEPCGPRGCISPGSTPTPTPIGTPTPYPTPTIPEGGGIPDYPTSWDTDGDGVIDNLPDMENPTFELPDSTLDQGPYLQTGLFLIDGRRCAGVRYWDPTYSTDSFDYNFTIEGTTYTGTETFDDPIGYYETCVDERQISSNGTYGSDEASIPSVENTLNGSSFNYSALGDGFAFNDEFDFGFGGGGSGTSSVVDGGGGVFAPDAPGGESGGSGLTGLLFLIGGLAAAVSGRRLLPVERAPDIPRIGTPPVSPVTLIVAITVIGLWVTGNVPSIGSALGFLGLVAFVWLDVVNR